MTQYDIGFQNFRSGPTSACLKPKLGKYIEESSWQSEEFDSLVEADVPQRGEEVDIS